MKYIILPAFPPRKSPMLKAKCSAGLPIENFLNNKKQLHQKKKIKVANIYNRSGIEFIPGRRNVEARLRQDIYLFFEQGTTEKTAPLLEFSWLA